MTQPDLLAPDSTASPSRWPRIRLAIVRSVLAYFSLTVFADIAAIVPGLQVGRRWLAYTVGKWMFGPGIPDGSQPTGSGDRAVDWALAALVLVVAVLVGVLWTGLSRRRSTGVPRWHALTLLFVRLHLGLILISYGAVKVFKSQFPLPTPTLLSRDLGDSSPMGLLWKFMGHSPGYNMFTGGAELLAGGLLLFRRTRLLGALLAIAVMTNVWVLNLAYDVAVKLGSSQLLLMALFVAAADHRRLRALWLPRARSQWPTGGARTLGTLLLGALVLLALGMTVVDARAAYQTWGDGRMHHPRYGSYIVVEHERHGEKVTPKQFGKRWARVHIHDDHVVVQGATGLTQAFTIQQHSDDALHWQVMDHDHGSGPLPEFHFDVTVPETDMLELKQRDGEGMRLLLRRKRYRLNSRQLHWVTEQGFNR